MEFNKGNLKLKLSNIANNYKIYEELVANYLNQDFNLRIKDNPKTNCEEIVKLVIEDIKEYPELLQFFNYDDITETQIDDVIQNGSEYPDVYDDMIENLIELNIKNLNNDEEDEDFDDEYEDEDFDDDTTSYNAYKYYYDEVEINKSSYNKLVEGLESVNIGVSLSQINEILKILQ